VEATVFGEHVDREIVQPVFENVGDTNDCEDGYHRRHSQARINPPTQYVLRANSKRADRLQIIERAI